MRARAHDSPYSTHQTLQKIPGGPHVSALHLLVEVHVPQIQPFRVGGHEPFEHRAAPFHRTVLELILGEPGNKRGGVSCLALVRLWLEDANQDTIVDAFSQLLMEKRTPTGTTPPPIVHHKEATNITARA